jgi:hypothetical protein
MTIPRLLVALEGPCCAGKTTLGRALLAELRDCEAALVACYADYAGGGRFLPRQEAGTVQEREEALRRLLEIEAARMAAVPGSCELLIADRSVHTLLAHSYAMEGGTGPARSVPPPPAGLCRSGYGPGGINRQIGRHGIDARTSTLAGGRHPASKCEGCRWTIARGWCRGRSVLRSRD